MGSYLTAGGSRFLLQLADPILERLPSKVLGLD